MDHNWRQQFSKNIKALVAKREKNKTVTEKKRLILILTTTPPSTMKDKEKEFCNNIA